MVYGKAYTLSDAMMNSDAEGTLSDQDWKNLGLSVKWAKFNVGHGSGGEYSYDRNFDNLISGAWAGSTNQCEIPAEWAGWRKPSNAEVQELFYASNRQWITGEYNGIKFNCSLPYPISSISTRSAAKARCWQWYPCCAAARWSSPSWAVQFSSKRRIFSPKGGCCFCCSPVWCSCFLVPDNPSLCKDIS